MQQLPQSSHPHEEILRTLVRVIQDTDRFIADYDKIRVMGFIGMSETPFADAGNFNTVASQKTFELSRALIHLKIAELGGLTLRHTDPTGTERKVTVFGFEGRSLTDPSEFVWQEGERQKDGILLGGKVAVQASQLADEARLFEDNL